jgi:hypothetical protein
LLGASFVLAAAELPQPIGAYSDFLAAQGDRIIQDG